MFKFKKVHKDTFGKVRETVEMKCHYEDLNSVLESFESFLRGAGYEINGHLEVVEDD